MPERQATSKVELVDQRLRDRRDVGLDEWLALKVKAGLSWRRIADLLDEDVGWETRPMSHEALRNRWITRGER